MNSSQQPPEFTKDPEETDEDAFRAKVRQDLFGDIRSPLFGGSEPTLAEAIRTAWQKAKDRQTPEQKKVTEEFWKEAKKPKTWAEFALMITVITALKKKRGWGKTKTLLAFLVTNETWSYIEDPERYKRAYKAAIHR